MTSTPPTSDGQPLLRHSLRWRLPALFGGLVVLMLLSFLWVSHREVEATLVRSGQERAQIAATQIGGMLEAALAGRASENEKLSTDPALRALLHDPTDANRAAAETALEPFAARPPRRAELWTADGRLLLAVSQPTVPDSASGEAPWSFPAGTRPTREEVSPLRAAGESSYFDLVVAIRDEADPASPPIGYLRRFGRITSNSGEAVRRLVGSDAVVRIGTLGSPVWTDFTANVAPPPVPAAAPASGSEAAGERHDGSGSMEGREWVGAYSSVQGTPWVTWIGFPHEMIVAPEQSFMQRMLLLGLLFLVVGVALVGILSARLTQPIHALAKAAEVIAGGDYSKRVGGERRDEVGRLSNAFNTMSGRIEEALGALRESHEQTHFALSAARIGVWESQLDSGQMTCSESMRFVLGTSADAIPRTVDDLVALVHAEDRETVRKLLSGAAVRDEVFDISFRAIWPDGSIHWIEAKGRVKPDERGKPHSLLGVCMDMTEQRRLEAELLQSQKLEAVGRLAGGIAHDFNNLLNVIQGCAYLLHAELPDGSEQQADAAEINRAAERAASLTKQLLAFSRKQMLQPKVIDPNEVVREVVRLLGRTIREDIDIITGLDPSLLRVVVDPGQLHQVLMNLAVNARDAMPDGGTITIESENVDVTAGDTRPTLRELNPGSYACLRVKDSGTGMDEATRAQIFEPFFTTKEVGKGTGLGLATVYGIVKQSGGDIRVESVRGEGTSFEIYLPQASVDQQVAPPAPAQSAQPGGGETILAVEDDPALRKLFRRVLEAHGYTVLQAGNGEDALRVAEHHDGKIDLVISDVIMPVMSGVEMAEKLAARYPGLRILFTSGYAEEEIARHGLQASGTGFLQKPVIPDVLLRTVRECLDSGSSEYEQPNTLGVVI
jgi:signal transduction histidine kinase/ActR/RegA family two-component response regulator